MIEPGSGSASNGAPPRLSRAEVAARPWVGHWIWSQERQIQTSGEFSSVPRVAPEAADSRVLFRRTFRVDRAPDAAWLRIAADSRYIVWVNGEEVARGPGRGHPSRLSADLVEVASLLRSGTNALAALVRYYGRPNAWWFPGPATFSHGAGVLVGEAHLPGRVIGTDGDWRAIRADAWTPQAPQGVGRAVPEVMDATRLDPNWTTPEFDDSTWGKARVIKAVHLGGTSRSTPPADPYGPMATSPLEVRTPIRVSAVAAMVGRSPVPHQSSNVADSVEVASREARFEGLERPMPIEVDLDEGSATVVVLRWPCMVAGTISVDVEAAEGTQVDLRMCESLTEDLAIPAHHHTHAIRLVCRDGRTHMESADPAGGVAAVVVLRGQGRARLLDVSVLQRNRPRPPGAFFTCSDERLNRIHQTGLRTVDLCAQDAYLDCPTREQRAWTGDSVVHQSVDLATNPDWSLARWHPVLAASSRADGMLPMAVACDFEHADATYIPDWALHWIRSVHNLYRYTGDRELIAELLPVAEGVLRWFARFERDGLLDSVTGWVLLDWASVQGRGQSTILNGLWGRALNDFAEMSSWVGDAGRAAWARRAHARLASAFQTAFDERRGGYRDWLHDGVVSSQMSEHATAAAVVGGLVPASRRAAARRLLLRRDVLVRDAWSFNTLPLRAAMGPPAPSWDVDNEVVAAQPFFRYVVHDALAELGAADHLPELLLDWSPLIDQRTGTWQETWAGGSRCHGWSSTPSRDLPLYVLGVSPAAPGFRRARVAPALGHLESASGAVPTPRGLLTVEVDGDRVAVTSPVPVELTFGGRTTIHEPGEIEVGTAEPVAAPPKT